MIAEIGAGLGVWGPMACAYCLRSSIVERSERKEKFYFVAFGFCILFHNLIPPARLDPASLFVWVAQFIFKYSHTAFVALNILEV